MNKRQRKKRDKKLKSLLDAMSLSTYEHWQPSPDLCKPTVQDGILTLDEVQGILDGLYRKLVENVQLTGRCIFVSTAPPNDKPRIFLLLVPPL